MGSYTSPSGGGGGESQLSSGSDGKGELAIDGEHITDGNKNSAIQGKQTVVTAGTTLSEVKNKPEVRVLIRGWAV